MPEGVFKPGDIVDRYRIVRPLGSGGTASVYEAYQDFLERRVALKVLQVRHAEREDVKRRMRAEAIVLSRIRHPNVVAVQDAGMTESGLIFIAMDLLEGQTLRDVLQSLGYLSIPEVLQFAVQIADGVEAAHKLGVIHRDLKPENVFIQKDNQLKVLDLGTAKFFGFHLETTDKMRWVGTPAYMSPEHLQGLGVTAQSDVYSLGLMLYEALAGVHPLLAGSDDVPTLNDLGWMQIYGEPKPLPELVPGVPDAVWQIIRRAIAKDPKQRHESMHKLALELRSVEHDYLNSCRERGLAPVRRQIEQVSTTGRAPQNVKTVTVRMDAVHDTLATAEDTWADLQLDREQLATAIEQPPPKRTEPLEPVARPPSFDMSRGRSSSRPPPAVAEVGAEQPAIPSAPPPPSVTIEAEPRDPTPPTRTHIKTDIQREIAAARRRTPASGWATIIDGWLPAKRSTYVLSAMALGVVVAVPLAFLLAHARTGGKRAPSASSAVPVVQHAPATGSPVVSQRPPPASPPPLASTPPVATEAPNAPAPAPVVSAPAAVSAQAPRVRSTAQAAAPRSSSNVLWVERSTAKTKRPAPKRLPELPGSGL
jgi:serine/threonine-protein kinase